MGSPTDSVEQAFLRCTVLQQIIATAKERVSGDNSNKYAIKLGIIEEGDKRDDAKLKIENMFAQLDGLIAHLTILDIVSSFECSFRGRLNNAIGEARKAIHNNYKLPSLFKVREGLVHSAEYYKGVGGIEKLLEPQLDGELFEQFKEIRKNRNGFAHGMDIEVPPTVDKRDALETLLAIGELL